MFPFSSTTALTLKGVEHVDVAVGIDIDVDRHVVAEVDVEFDVGVDVEVCVLMLIVMLMVMLSWVGGGGNGHLCFDAAGTKCARKRAAFGCFKPAEDHETRNAFSNRLCSTIASTTDLISLARPP